uniref:Uncharacterized protein n=1 Tax=Anopheles minimus TaxID=112268 RepID=A0A182W2H8_9DIPT
DVNTAKTDTNALIKALQAEKEKTRLLEALLEKSRKGPIRQNTWLEEPSEAQFMEGVPCTSSTILPTATTPANELSLTTSLSFAIMQIESCKPKEGEQEIDRNTFEQWKNKFEAAIEFAGITSEPTKMNAFKMKAGHILIDMLQATSPNDSKTDAGLSPKILQFATKVENDGPKQK